MIVYAPIQSLMLDGTPNPNQASQKRASMWNNSTVTQKNKTDHMYVETTLSRMSRIQKKKEKERKKAS